MQSLTFFLTNLPLHSTFLSDQPAPSTKRIAGRFLNREPVIYNTETFQWSAPGSLAMAIKPRLYHSSAVLLPNCQVMASGSDVSCVWGGASWV